MKLHKANKEIELYEQLVDLENLQITHLSLEKDKLLDTHKHPWKVIVVIYSGKVDFTGENKSEIIVPGDVIEMEGGEEHKLLALEDSELMVIKANLK